MSCTRQLDARELINKPDDVTRSTVQKSVVVVAKSPHVFTAWREKLSLVTRAWFMQKEFTNTTILKDFQENLAEGEANTTDEQRDHFVGVSLREFIHEYKHQALVLFKCCLLQPKMLFFGSKCERLCMMQFALISLIPGLIRKLDDCAEPELDSYDKTATAPTSYNAGDRASILAYVGLPVQIFGKGSLFGPYTPLQQLDVLADYGTKSYIVGSTNSLLLQQNDRYSDILINLDDSTINVTSSSLRAALSLTAADRRWIDLIYQDIAASWDPSNPTRPSHHGFKGSEDYIRIHFEQYIIALLSATKYHAYLAALPPHQRSSPSSLLPDVDGDPAADFGEHYLDAWRATASHALWARLTADLNIFDFVDPRHPTAGGFSIDDFNRRFAQQFHDLQLDERFAASRDALGKGLASGQKKVSAAINTVWAEYESRKAARAAAAAASAANDPAAFAPRDLDAPPGSTATATATTPSASAQSFFDAQALRARAPDLTGASAAASAAGQKAGAYFSSWGSWAAERRKGWGAPRGQENTGEKAQGRVVSPPQSPQQQQGPRPLLLQQQVGERERERVEAGRVERERGKVEGKVEGGGARERGLSEKGGGGNGVGTGTGTGTGAGAGGGGMSVRDMVREREKRKSAGSVHGPTSPRRGVIRRGVSREEMGQDGIGRLDA